MDEFDKKANKIKLAAWQVQEISNLNIKLIIKLNIKSTPIQMLVGCKSAYKI